MQVNSSCESLYYIVSFAFNRFYLKMSFTPTGQGSSLIMPTAPGRPGRPGRLVSTTPDDGLMGNFHGVDPAVLWERLDDHVHRCLDSDFIRAIIPPGIGGSAPAA
jgi:hypothetical protein